MLIFVDLRLLTLAEVWVGLKMGSFVDSHYCIYADILGGSYKIKKYADVVMDGH